MGGDEFMEPPRKRPRIEEDWWDWGFGKGPPEPDRWRGKGTPNERSSGKGQEPRRAVERFLESNGITDKAAMILRDAPPEVQNLVLERGSLLECRNPSGALVGRVNAAADQLGLKGAGGKGHDFEDPPGMGKGIKGKGKTPIGA